MSSSASRGILFLSHRGLSFVDDLMALTEKLGLESYVLSSAPAPENAERIGKIGDKARWCAFTKSVSLAEIDVTEALERLRAHGKTVVAVLSVWEGYRTLMAKANARLGTPDVSAQAVELVLDKFALRTELLRTGLSGVATRIVNRDNYAALPDFPGKRFVKPRRGLASFGAFAVASKDEVAGAFTLLSEMIGDEEYRSVFQGSEDFVLEDFIPGTEFSFELLVADGELFCLGVHEKLEVDAGRKTTLESTCVCPPAHLDAAEQAVGYDFLERVFAALNLDQGCYHVETRYDRDSARWEIIEINPRVGGALINDSVKLRLGSCLLEAWLKLLTRHPETAGALRTLADAACASDGAVTTFFRVYFGEPGSMIEKIVRREVEPAPSVVKISAREGLRLPDSSREIFLGQALWGLKSCLAHSQLDALASASKTFLEVTYG